MLRSSRARKCTFGIITFAVLAYVVMQPYFVSRTFRRAYSDGDFKVAEQFVDFPALRENLLQRAKNDYHEPAKKDQAASMYNLKHAFMQSWIESTVRQAALKQWPKRISTKQVKCR